MKFLGLFFIGFILHAQQLEILNQEQDSVSFRGLSIVPPKTVWVSGSSGTIGRSTDEGRSFQWFHPKGFEKNDFRDIEAFNDSIAFAMAITEKAAILLTQNGGNQFKEVFSDSHPKAFLDAISCLNTEQCFCIGDALKPKQFYLLKLKKGKWKSQKTSFKTLEGEAFFAASGSNIQMLNDTDFLAVSGGKASRLFSIFKGITQEQELPLLQGKESTGANGFYYDTDTQIGMVVGGDFSKPESSMFNLVIFSWDETSHSFQFSFPTIPPSGYKSSIAQLEKDTWICCGTSGIDISYDRGKTWQHFSNEAFHSIRKLKGNALLLVGPKGKIARLQF